jgi:hypothetical protein
MEEQQVGWIAAIIIGGHCGCSRRGPSPSAGDAVLAGECLNHSPDAPRRLVPSISPAVYSITPRPRPSIR